MLEQQVKTPLDYMNEVIVRYIYINFYYWKHSILTNFEIEFLRLSLKFYVLRIVSACKTFKGEYGTMC